MSERKACQQFRTTSSVSTRPLASGPACLRMCQQFRTTSSVSTSEPAHPGVPPTVCQQFRTTSSVSTGEARAFARRVKPVPAVPDHFVGFDPQGSQASEPSGFAARVSRGRLQHRHRSPKRTANRPRDSGATPCDERVSRGPGDLPVTGPLETPRPAAGIAELPNSIAKWSGNAPRGGQTLKDLTEALPSADEAL